MLGLGTLNSQLSVVIRAMVDGHVIASGVLSHPIYVLIYVCGIDNEEEFVFAKLINQQVVYRSAVGIKHHSVEHFANGRTGYVVGKDVVDVFFGLVSCDIHFTHVRNVEHAAMVTHGVMFVGDRRILNGHVVARKRLHQCT